MEAGKSGRENGEIMLEGMIVVIITVFILFWILGLGFFYYQKYLNTVVTNDAAKKIASTYNNIDSDIIMGYVDTEALTSRNLYRRFINGKLEKVNQARAEQYIKYRLDKNNFTGVIKDVEVEMNLVLDSTIRRHVELTTTCTYNNPFGWAPEIFGMKGVNTYQVKACADCTDYADYICTVDFSVWVNEKIIKDVNIFDSTNKLFKNMIELFDTMVSTYNR